LPAQRSRGAEEPHLGLQRRRLLNRRLEREVGSREPAGTVGGEVAAKRANACGEHPLAIERPVGHELDECAAPLLASKAVNVGETDLAPTFDLEDAPERALREVGIESELLRLVRTDCADHREHVGVVGLDGDEAKSFQQSDSQEAIS
jgi:hypothetical protein